MRAALPPYWEQAELDGLQRDLCKLCAETLREVLLNGPGPTLVPPVVAAGQHSRYPRPQLGSLPRPSQLATRVALRPSFTRVRPHLRPSLSRARHALRDRFVLSGLCVVASLILVGAVSATGGVPVILATGEPSAHPAEPREEAAAAVEPTEAPVTTVVESPVPPEVTPAHIPEPPAADAALAALPGELRVTAIGDSVMLAATEDLARLLGTVEVDAAVGRQGSGALEVLRAKQAAGPFDPIVVLHIGHNGLLTPEQVEEMLQILSDVRTVLVMNLRVALPWEVPNNALLAEAVARHPNAVLVDWAAASANRPELFWADGIHLTPAGAAAYAEVLVAGLRTTDGRALVQQPVPPAQTPAVPTPLATALATPTAAPTATTVASALTAGGATLSVTAQESMQVRVSVDGASAFNGTLAAGESGAWGGGNRVQLWTDDAKNLLVTVNGYNLGPLSAAVGHPDWNTVDWTWSADWTPG